MNHSNSKIRQDEINYAQKLHRKGRLEKAEKCYRKILKHSPKHIEALHFLGVLTHQSGKSKEALDLIRRALELKPDYLDARNNLGNILKELNLFDEAESTYRHVIAIQPDFPDAHNNLGVTLKSLGRLDEAINSYRKAIELNSNYLDAYINLGNALVAQKSLQEAEATYRHIILLKSDYPVAHFNLGLALKSQGRIEEAVESYQKAIEFNPTYIDAFNNLAYALSILGRTQEAIEIYNKCLKNDPGNPIANHMLAATSGQLIPKRATNAYVEEVFDQFAESFDESLKELDYRAPQLVAEAVEQLFTTNQSQLKIYDAGCGTGLCAHYLKPYAKYLVGVDLSTAMVDKAKKLLLYDELIVSELTNHLLEENNSYDLIVSADTLCYFGALEEVLNATNKALGDDGYLIFTAEHTSEELDQGYKISPHGRYSHNETYIISALKNAEFAVKSIKNVTLRRELGKPVEGLVVIAQKCPARNST